MLCRAANKCRQDDINPDLLRETARLERDFPMQKIEAAQFETFFERRLEEIYDPDKEALSSEAAEQEALLKRLQDANAAFTTVRKGDTTTREREQALQRLENAYFKYKEIISNLEAGRKFYNDLARMVTRFRDECRGFVYQRRSEAGQIEAYVISFPSRCVERANRVLDSDLSTQFSSLNLGKAASLQQEKEAQAQRPIYNMPPPSAQGQDRQQPLAAPQPQRAPAPGVWTPDMPIAFGSPAPNAGNALPAGAAGASQKGKPDGRWDPNSGLRFG